METKAFIGIDPEFRVEEDEFGVEYDITNKRLLSITYKLVYNKIKHYSVRPGTKVICDGAFNNHSFIESIELPSGLKVIEKNAFFGCESLKIINFPDGLLKIEDCAFYNCINLNSIQLPSSIVIFGSYIFYGCTAIQSFEIDKNNDNFIFESGIIYSKDKACIICAITTFTKTDICFLEGLKEIKEGAFSHCSSLVSVILPESVEVLGESAFENCISLQTINLPDKLKSIGNSCFAHSTITSISIPENVESIGLMAFSACYALTAINVAKSNRHYTSKNGVLFSKDEMTLLNYPSASKLLSYIIPKTSRIISSGAFQSCLYLEKVELPIGLSKINGNTFSNCRCLIKANIPDGIIEIGEYAFEGCGLLEEIQLPDSVNSIKISAFENCRSLKNINIPSELTQIESDVFSLCDKLKVEVDLLNPRYKSFDGMIYEKCNYIFGLIEFYDLEVPF